MSMKSLVATAAFSYQTRRLRPGDPFQAKDGDARVLIAIKKAELAREPANVTAPPQRLVEKIIERDPLDRDGDGRRGGSLPEPRKAPRKQRRKRAAAKR